MTTRVLLLVVVTTQSLLAAALVLGDVPSDSRVLWSVSATHGVHVRDLPVVAVWAVGALACLLLLRRQR